MLASCQIMNTTSVDSHPFSCRATEYVDGMSKDLQYKQVEDNVSCIHKHPKCRKSMLNIIYLYQERNICIEE